MGNAKFKILAEGIEKIIKAKQNADESNVETAEDLSAWDGIDMLEDVAEEDGWVPSTSIIMVAEIVDNLVKELKVDEDDAIAFVSEWLEEAYKWSHAVTPGDKDVSTDVGTIDEPSHGVPKRGFRERPSGLTPSADEGMRVILNTLSQHPPKPIMEFPVEVASETWKEALGKALNKGIGVKWELDKKTGINYPSPDYSVIYGIWKEMLAKQVGVRPSREGEVKLKHALDTAAKVAAKDLRKGIEALGAKRGAQASAILRGRKGEKNPSAKAR